MPIEPEDIVLTNSDGEEERVKLSPLLRKVSSNKSSKYAYS